jgi:hypothetical protein
LLWGRIPDPPPEKSIISFDDFYEQKILELSTADYHNRTIHTIGKCRSVVSNFSGFHKVDLGTAEGAFTFLFLAGGRCSLWNFEDAFETSKVPWSEKVFFSE